MKDIVGKVTSAKSQKTITVVVERLFRAPLYHKVIKKRKKYTAHDELGAKEGDLVRLVETRPLSKMKRWRAVEIVNRESDNKPSKSKKVTLIKKETSAKGGSTLGGKEKKTK